MSRLVVQERNVRSSMLLNTIVCGHGNRSPIILDSPRLLALPSCCVFNVVSDVATLLLQCDKQSDIESFTATTLNSSIFV